LRRPENNSFRRTIKLNGKLISAAPATVRETANPDYEVFRLGDNATGRLIDWEGAPEMFFSPDTGQCTPAKQFTGFATACGEAGKALLSLVSHETSSL
jgi:hypothetical protein